MKLSSHFRRAAVLGLSCCWPPSWAWEPVRPLLLMRPTTLKPTRTLRSPAAPTRPPLLRHYLSSGQAEGRKPSAWGSAGDSLKLTNEQIALVWSPVPLKDLANYKSLKKKMTDEQYQAAYQEAVNLVLPVALSSREEQLTYIAAALRERFDSGMSYSMDADHYNDPYGYFVLGSASCAGCTRATGLCLNVLGIPYEHVNENQYSHQWCRVPVGGTYWICDAYGLYCGPEPAPYQHPYFQESPDSDTTKSRPVFTPGGFALWCSLFLRRLPSRGSAGARRLPAPPRSGA